jgi:hypothetical protein
MDVQSALSSGRGLQYIEYTCSADAHVSLGVNPYGVEEHAWRVCEHARQA